MMSKRLSGSRDRDRWCRAEASGHLAGFADPLVEAGRGLPPHGNDDAEAHGEERRHGDLHGVERACERAHVLEQEDRAHVEDREHDDERERGRAEGIDRDVLPGGGDPCAVPELSNGGWLPAPQGGTGLCFGGFAFRQAFCDVVPHGLSSRLRAGIRDEQESVHEA